MSESSRYRETQYGFQYGPAIVERVASDPKWGVMLDVRSAKQVLEIRITPSGLIRVGKPQKSNDGCLPFEERFVPRAEIETAAREVESEP